MAKKKKRSRAASAKKGYSFTLSTQNKIILGSLLILFSIALFFSFASFYFTWLEMSLNRTENLRDGIAGDLWAVHGGGFYFIEKYFTKRISKKFSSHFFIYAGGETAEIQNSRLEVSGVS